MQWDVRILEFDLVTCRLLTLDNFSKAKNVPTFVETDLEVEKVVCGPKAILLISRDGK